jgi:fumarate hydratase subunit beta
VTSAEQLIAPFDDRSLEALRSGDQVVLSGILITARDAAHERFARSRAKTGSLPFDPRGQVMYFVGPTPARPGNPIGSAGPTTASRMDVYSPALVALGLKGMIGKGRRSPEVKRSMLEHGCVYFGAVEGTAALLAQCITSSELVAYADLGAEAVFRLTVSQFPVVVINDLHGNDLYDDGPSKWARPHRWDE